MAPVRQEKIAHYRKKSSKQRYRCRRCGEAIFLVMKPDGTYIAAREVFRGVTPSFHGEQLYDPSDILPHYRECFQNSTEYVGWLRSRFDGIDVFSRKAKKLLYADDVFYYNLNKRRLYAEGFVGDDAQEEFRRSMERSDDPADMGRVLDERGRQDAAMSGGGYLDWCDRGMGPGNPAAIPEDLGEDFTWEELRGDEGSAGVDDGGGVGEESREPDDFE